MGQKYQFQNKEYNIIIDCEVLVVDEPFKLSYRWTGGSLNTVVTWTLKEEDGKTHLHIEQTGEFKGEKFGWATMVAGLKKVVE